MPTEGPNWELRVSALWASLDDRTEADFLAAIEELVAERPPDYPAATFEHAAALDSTGHSDLAVPLYQQALDLGLTGLRRRRAVIQRRARCATSAGRPRASLYSRPSSMPNPTSSTTPSAPSSPWPWSMPTASEKPSPWPSPPWRRTSRATSAQSRTTSELRPPR